VVFVDEIRLRGSFRRAQQAAGQHPDGDPQKQGWALVALDCAVTMTTAAGEAMADVSPSSPFERRLIS
jgi:hypothetical protein